MDFELIKNLCIEKKITIPELSERIGMSKAGLYTTIKNQTISVTILEKIAEVLEVPVTVFFKESLINPEDEEALLNYKTARTALADCKKEIEKLNVLVNDKLNIIKLITQNEQLVLEMYVYFDSELSTEEKKILARNKYYEKFIKYLVSCFGMNINSEIENPSLYKANKQQLESTNKKEI